jgi:hypothetical protein
MPSWLDLWGLRSLASWPVRPCTYGGDVGCSWLSAVFRRRRWRQIGCSCLRALLLLRPFPYPVEGLCAVVAGAHCVLRPARLVAAVPIAICRFFFFYKYLYSTLLYFCGKITGAFHGNMYNLNLGRSLLLETTQYRGAI